MRISWNTPSAAAARALRRPGRPRAAQTRPSRRSRRPPSRCAPACLPRPLGSAPVWKSRASGHVRQCDPHCPPASRRALRGPPRAPGQAQKLRLFALSPSPRPPRPPSAHLSGRPVPPDRRGTARVSGGGVWSGARGSSGRPGPSRGSEGGGAGVRRAGGPELAAPRPRPPPLPWRHEGSDTCLKAPEPQMVPRRGGGEVRD